MDPAKKVLDLQRRVQQGKKFRSYMWGFWGKFKKLETCLLEFFL